MSSEVDQMQMDVGAAGVCGVYVCVLQCIYVVGMCFAGVQCVCCV